MIIPNLVGGLEPWNFYDFPYSGNVIIPTDELMFFRGVAQPPTSKLIFDITMLYNHQQGFRLHGSNDENGLKNMEIL